MLKHTKLGTICRLAWFHMIRVSERIVAAAFSGGFISACFTSAACSIRASMAAISFASLSNPFPFIYSPFGCVHSANRAHACRSHHVTFLITFFAYFLRKQNSCATPQSVLDQILTGARHFRIRTESFSCPGFPDRA
jgi:hypothetical protein